MSDAVIAHLAAERPAILERLKTLIRIPSVSTDPAFAADMQAARDFLLDRLRTIGLQNVQLLDGGTGQPAVFGEWMGAPGRPTIDRLWALRRAARRPAGAMAHPALRADGTGWPAVCARRLRCEGLDHHRHRDRRRIPGTHRRLPDQHQAVPGRRGGIRQPEPARHRGKAIATNCRRTPCCPPMAARQHDDADAGHWRARPGGAGIHAAHGHQGCAFRPLWRRGAQCGGGNGGPGGQPA